MPVTGDCNGLVTENRLLRKVEPLISVKQLKSVYLTGLNIKDPNTDKELPDETYKQFIANAVAWLETYLNISISPVSNYTENHDYHYNDYVEWGFIELHNYPVIQVNTMKMVYFRDANGDPETLIDIPTNWIRLQPHDGIIRLIPNAQFAANLQVGGSGSYFPEILKGRYVPHLWQINYDFGFRDGEIPVLINNAVGLMASLQALSVGGNLVLGAGIAGSNISFDGLSQGIQTTQSAENSAYSATRKEYQDQMFGKTKDDPFAIIKILQRYYKGAEFGII